MSEKEQEIRLFVRKLMEQMNVRSCLYSHNRLLALEIVNPLCRIEIEHHIEHHDGAFTAVALFATWDYTTRYFDKIKSFKIELTTVEQVFIYFRIIDKYFNGKDPFIPKLPDDQRWIKMVEETDFC